jgi:hypothetical protein
MSYGHVDSQYRNGDPSSHFVKKCWQILEYIKTASAYELW